MGNPAAGTVLYSATGFTATSTTPQSSTDLFNLIDATTPFELTSDRPARIGAGGSGGRAAVRCPATAPRPPGACRRSHSAGCRWG